MKVQAHYIRWRTIDATKEPRLLPPHRMVLGIASLRGQHAHGAFATKPPVLSNGDLADRRWTE